MQEESKLVRLTEAESRIEWWLPGATPGEAVSGYSIGVSFQLHRAVKSESSVVVNSTISYT